MATAITSDLYSGLPDPTTVGRRTMRAVPAGRQQIRHGRDLQAVAPDGPALDGVAPARVIADPRGPGVPVAANLVYGTQYENAVDPTHTGIAMHHNGSRLARASGVHMTANRKVLDRVETDPYTGRRVEYYRKLPPDGNQDRRLPKETMQHVNRRLVALTGYDPTRPARQRREVIRTNFQPDKTHSDAAMFKRRMGELQERAGRAVQVNQTGERPSWHRESRRAFGFAGYHNLMRVTPYVPPTMRADTEARPGPKSVVVNAPASVRNQHRTARRRPATEINQREQPLTGAPAGPAPTIMDRATKHREGQTSKGLAAPVTGHALPPVPGRSTRATKHREGQTTEGLGGLVSGHALPPLPGRRDRIATHREGQTTEGLAGLVSGHTLPPVPGQSTRPTMHREGQTTEGLGAPATGHALPPVPGRFTRDTTHREGQTTEGLGGLVSGNALPPVISHTLQGAVPLRADAAGAVMSGFGSVTGPGSAPQVSRHLVGNAPHRETDRIDDRTFMATPSATSTGALSARDAQRPETRRRIDATSAEAGKRARGHGGANVGGATDAPTTHVFMGRRLADVRTAGFEGPVGADAGTVAPRAARDNLDARQHRAATGGLRPGTTMSHGGGLGSGFTAGNTFNRAQFGSRVDSSGDRTVINSIYELQSRAQLM